VNSVCFCFPFFFDLPDPDSAAFELSSPSSSGALTTDPDAPPLHAEVVGAVSRKMFFNDWFPLTFTFCRAELEAGSSGNTAFDKGVGAFFRGSFAPGPGTDIGARTPELALADHGVFLCACRNVGITAGKAAGKAGKRSGGLAVDEEPAACATRSKSCLDDCWEEREAVEGLTFKTLPPAIPA